MKKKLFFFCCLFILTTIVVRAAEDVKKVKESPDSTSKSKLTDYQKLFDKKKCITKNGVITIHLVDNEKVFFEFPLSVMETEMLLGSTVSEISNNAHSVLGYKSKMPMHIKFSMAPKKVNLCMINDTYTTDQENIKEAVKRSTIGAIFQSFEIKAYSPDSSAVVFDATPLFLSHIEDLDPFDPFGEYGNKPFKRNVTFQKEQSQLGAIKAFQDNFSVTSYLTYKSTVTYTNGKEAASIENNAPVTALVNRSFLILPKEPMRPRLADPRINIFPTGKANFTTNNNRGTLPEYYARRWNLQPKDVKAWKAGKLVEPVKPITFYIDDHFPETWKGPIKEAVELWNDAFEKIGFKGAIRALPYPKDDPEFDPDNLKYSCLRYQPISIKNAMGPSWFDPRSGEIVNASVMVYHDVIKLVGNWLFVQTAQTDKRIQGGIIPKEVMDDALRYVISHEVGHCLSLMHNMASSAAIPVESLRDPKFTQKTGTTYCIMDYARFNYVAQPGDFEKGVKLTPPKLGLYDYFSIKWLYSPMPDAKTYKEEEKTLSKWISEKSGDPRYRYGKQQVSSMMDPSSQSEDLGDDLVKASEYGVKNIKYIMKNLNTWVAKNDPDLTLREDLYKGLLQQYFQYIMHVYAVKGGVYMNERYQGDKWPSYKFVEAEYQRRAQKFLCEQLNDLDWMEPADLLQEIPLLGNMSVKMQKTILSLVMADRGTLTTIENKEENAFDIEANQQMALDALFKGTKEGRSLNAREFTNQNLYIDYLVMLSKIDNGKTNQNPMALTDNQMPEFFSTDMFSESQGVNFFETTPEDVAGFAFFRGLSASMSPKYHIYYSKLLQIKDLIEAKKDTGSSDTKAHYALMLHKINGILL